MNFIEFRNKMKPFGIFSVTDIEKMFPDFARLNLINWQKKGYIIKIRRQWYCFTDESSYNNLAWLAANRIYQPSYISLQTALSYYEIIPEAVYVITSVATKKTNQFNTPIGYFSYNKIKPQIFGFGQSLVSVAPGKASETYNKKILMAEPEKAILDFFYINAGYKNREDIEQLRFNSDIINDNISRTKIYDYLEQYKSKALKKRIDIMLDVCDLS